MPTKVAKPYHPAIDILRIISICAVVLIHTSTKTIAASNNDIVNIPWSLFLNQSMRFAVPLFFMISGFVLTISHSYNAHYGMYVKKRLGRIVLPYVTWSIIYYFFIFTHNGNTLWYSLLEGTASYQLYFIPTLLLFYALFPLLHSQYRFIANKWVIIFLGLLQCGILAYEYYVHPIPIFLPIKTAMLNYFIFILGMIAAHHQAQLITFTKKWKYVLATTAIILMYSIYAEGKFFFLATHNYLSFYSQWRPDILVYTIVLGGALYAFFQQTSIPVKLIKVLSSLSFFVFFIHIIILGLVWDTIGQPLFDSTHGLSIQNVFFDPLFFLIVCTISFTCAYIIRKIPYLSKVTG